MGIFGNRAGNRKGRLARKLARRLWSGCTLEQVEFGRGPSRADAIVDLGDQAVEACAEYLGRARDAYFVLGRIGTDAAVLALGDELRQRDWRRVELACNAMGMVESRLAMKLLPELEALAKSSVGEVVLAAGEAINSLRARFKLFAPLGNGTLVSLGTGEVSSLCYVNDAPFDLLAVAGNEVHLLRSNSAELLDRAAVCSSLGSDYHRALAMPNGTTVALASPARLTVWDASASQCAHLPVKEAQAKDRIVAMAASHDGRFVATASRDGLLRVWSLAAQDQKAHLKLKVRELCSGNLYRVLLHFVGDSLVLGAGVRPVQPGPEYIVAFVWRFLETDEPSPIGELDACEPPAAFAVNPSGRSLVVGEHLVTISRPEAKPHTRTLPEHCLPRYLRAVSFACKGKYLICGGVNERTLRRYDLQQGESLALGDQEMGVWNAFTTSDDRHVVVARWDNRIEVWEAETATLAQTLDGHRSRITAIAAGRGGRLASADDSGNVVLWTWCIPP